MSQDLLQNDEKSFYNQLLNDFNKTKEDLDEYIEIMRKWADTQAHFPEKPRYRTLRFVVLYNKFSIEKAKQKLDMYYTIRNLMPEFFKCNPFSPDMVFQSKVWYLVPLPKVTEGMVRIVYHKLNPEYSDPTYFNHDKMICHLIHLVEYLLEEDLCYRFHYIFDCAAMKVGHSTSFNPMTIKKASIVLEKVFSNRITSFYIVNVAHFMETIINNVMKPMLNPKIRERLQVSNAETLLEIFGKERMPKDVGGEEKSLKELSEILMENYQKREDRFLQLEKLSVNESLRPAKLKNDEVLGYYGSFKQINVD